MATNKKETKRVLYELLEMIGWLPSGRLKNELWGKYLKNIAMINDIAGPHTIEWKGQEIVKSKILEKYEMELKKPEYHHEKVFEAILILKGMQYVIKVADTNASTIPQAAMIIGDQIQEMAQQAEIRANNYFRQEKTEIKTPIKLEEIDSKIFKDISKTTTEGFIIEKLLDNSRMKWFFNSIFKSKSDSHKITGEQLLKLLNDHGDNKAIVEEIFKERGFFGGRDYWKALQEYPDKLIALAEKHTLIQDAIVHNDKLFKLLHKVIDEKLLDILDNLGDNEAIVNKIFRDGGFFGGRDYWKALQAHPDKLIAVAQKHPAVRDAIFHNEKLLDHLVKTSKERFSKLWLLQVNFEKSFANFYGPNGIVYTALGHSTLLQQYININFQDFKKEAGNDETRIQYFEKAKSASDAEILDGSYGKIITDLKDRFGDEYDGKKCSYTAYNDIIKAWMDKTIEKTENKITLNENEKTLLDFYTIAANFVALKNNLGSILDSDDPSFLISFRSDPDTQTKETDINFWNPLTEQAMDELDQVYKFEKPLLVELLKMTMTQSSTTTTENRTSPVSTTDSDLSSGIASTATMFSLQKRGASSESDADEETPLLENV